MVEPGVVVFEDEASAPSLSATVVKPPTLDECKTTANKAHRAVGRAVKSALDQALKSGEALRAAKQQVAHGEWLKWLQDNFDGSVDTAELYMRIAHPANTETIRNLQPSERNIAAA